MLLAHSGVDIAAKFKEALLMNDTVFQTKANVKCLQEFEIDKNMNSIIVVESGGVILRGCLLSLR